MMTYNKSFFMVRCLGERVAITLSLFCINKSEMIENNETNTEVVASETTETANTETVTVTETVTTVEEPKEEVKAETPKQTRRKSKKEEIQIAIEPADSNKELDDLKAELEAMKQEKSKLEEERTALNETISKLQEEVKITPQKLGQAIKEMGVTPIKTVRDNSEKMTLEAYNSMTDTARREWQRKNRAEYLEMMHRVKLY